MLRDSRCYHTAATAGTFAPRRYVSCQELRAQLLARATGRVLEVGVGTGLNLRHYPRDSVSAIDAVDLSPGMLGQVRSGGGRCCAAS